MIVWNSRDPAQIKAKGDYGQVYRAAFSGADGKRALMLLLSELFVFDQTQTPEQVTLRNFGIQLLEAMGIYHEGNLQELIDFFMTQNDPELIQLLGDENQSMED